MNIGFDAKRLYNNFTGLGNHSRTTIDILTDYYPENAYFLFTPKLPKNCSISESTALSYLEKAHCQTIQPNGLLKGSLWRTFGLPSEVQKHDIHLFHGLSNELPVGIDKTGKPSVVTIHDVAFHTFTEMYHWHDRQIYDMKWRYAVNHSDRIIAISECTKSDIIKYYGVDASKIDVVYQPVSRRFYAPMSKSDASRLLELSNLQLASDYMLYVGSINSRKNLLGVVKALETLPKDLQMPLVVVGGGREYKVEVQKYISAHNLDNLVIFPSKRIDDDTLQALYTNARLFVYPSFYEGFGLPVVEALLSGCPVVTSNVSSLPEAGGPHSLMVNPSDVDDIADKMRLALTDSVLYAEMKRDGYDYAVSTFHPKVLAERLMSVYRKVL